MWKIFIMEIDMRENSCIAMAMDLYSELEECRMVSQETRKEYENMVAKIRNQASFENLKVYVTRFQ